MHEYRRLVQSELDDRGWSQSDLARRAGMGRSVINKILNDDREHLGQMPDDSTMDGIARGFGIPVERVRRAAARSLIGYVDDGLGDDPLESYTVEFLLEYTSRRAAKELAAARMEDEPKPNPE